MLNEEKIKLMTKMALYEQKEGKQDISAGKYFKGDYLTIKIINSTITVTVGYIVLLMLFVFVNAEKLLSKVIGGDFLAIGEKLLFSYLIVVLINGIITFLIYSRKYDASYENLKNYKHMLSELATIQKEEQTVEAGKFTQNIAALRKQIEGFGGQSDDRITKN